MGFWLVRLGAACGIVLGFLWGFHHQVHPTCVPAHTGQALGRCANHSIMVIATHWVFALGGGIVIGGAIGLALMVVWRSRRAARLRPPRRRPAPSPPQPPQVPAPHAAR